MTIKLLPQSSNNIIDITPQQTDIWLMLNQVGDLDEKINDLKSELKPLVKEFESLNSELIGKIDDSSLEVKGLRNDEFLFQITQKGFSRDNFKYKVGFDESLLKVNKNTRKILEKELEKTRTESWIKPKTQVIKLKS